MPLKVAALYQFAALPDFRNLAIEAFLEKYEGLRVSRAP